MARKLSKKELEEMVHKLAWNDRYGCYTRPGFEKWIWPDIADQAKWVIMFDIDDMHHLNEVHSHAGMNDLIKKSLAMRSTDYVAGQWESGDEFVVCITEDGSREGSDPVLLCERLKEDFLSNGIPATFGIAPVTSRTFVENVEPAAKMVEEAKKANRRGRIYFK